MLAAACVFGIDIGSPSPLVPYTQARLLGEQHIIRTPDEPRLVDWGCGVRWGMKGIRDVGLVPEDLWPETEANLNAVPDLASFKAGESATIKSFHRISDDGQASAEIIAAGRRGYAPIVCMMVDQKFVDIGREVYDGPGGDQLGGHALVVVAYSAVLGAFAFDNWWGDDFGDEGFVWISEAVVNSLTYDKWVIESAPGSGEA